METRTISLNVLTCIGLAAVCTVARPAAGMIIARPLEYSLTDAHVIVAGKIMEMTRDKKVKRKAGDKWYADYYRLGYVQVDEVLKNDLAHFIVEPGDRIEIRLGPTAKRMKALARERHIISEGGPYRSTEKGDGGIWQLRLSSPDEPLTFTPLALMKMEMLGKVKESLDKLDREYRDALKSSIPLYDRRRKELLSTPACTQAMADAAMGRIVAPEVDLSEVYAVNYGSMQTLFVAHGGQVLGGIPYSASAESFNEGYLPVATAPDSIYSRFNYVDRNGKLLCSKSYLYAESFSEGRALVQDSNGFGYIDARGKEIIPCTYRLTESFSHGTTKVSKDGRETVLIDKMGTIVGTDVGEINRRDSFTKIEAHDEDQRINLYGFADRQGNTVIPPKFLHVMGFSDGMAAVEMTVWAERTGIYGNPAIELSEKVHRHILVARWGFINEEGEIEIPALFDSVGPFQNGLANVRIYLRPKIPGQNSMFEGLIDKAGNLVLVKSNPSL